MQLQCVQCRAPITADMTACPACGRPVDADGNGLPDALDRMVNAAAKKAVAQEREAQNARESKSRERDHIRKQLARVEAALKENRAAPRSFARLALERMKTTFLAMCAVWVIIGAPFHFITGAMGFAISGPLVCAVQCGECRGPGRVFTWNYRGSCQANKGRMGYALVCHNPRYDVDAMTRMDLVDEARNDALQPYIVHSVVAFFADGFVLAAVVALYRGLFRTHKRLAELDPELRRLEREEHELRTRMAALRT